MKITHSIAMVLISTAALVTTCKQSDFTGSSGDDGKKGATGTNSTGIKGGSDGVPTVTPNASATPTPSADPSTPPGSTPPGGCVSSNNGVVMNFENSPVGPFDGSTFWTTRGVRFMTNMRVVATTRLNQSQPPKDEQAWLCAKCAGSPSRNRLIDAAAETQVGTRVLASAIPRSETQTIDVAFAAPVAVGSFDLIDDDGSEQWTLILFNQASQALENRPLSTLKGYRPSSTGNGRPMTLTFSRPTADVLGMRLIGHKSGGFFGFAFDNFNFDVCPATH